jgi:hypothetical protein
MITHIIFLIVGYGLGWLTGWIIDRRIYKIVKNENIRDWYQYGKGRKYR